MQSQPHQSIPLAGGLPVTTPSHGHLIAELPAVIDGHPSRPTIWRWILEGILAPNGERVKLSSLKVGGRRIVTNEAIAEFLAAINATPTEDADGDIPAGEKPPGQSVGRALDALGC